MEIEDTIYGDAPFAGKYYEYSMNDFYGHFLIFDDAVLATLPEGSAEDGFEAEIYDRETNRLHNARINYPEYANLKCIDVSSGEEKSEILNVLNPYSYSGHWCGCHRGGNLIGEGVPMSMDLPPFGPEPADEIELLNRFDGDESTYAYCQSGQYLVVKLWHRSNPDRILFYETVSR